MSDALLRVQRVVVGYRPASPILHGVSAEIRGGDDACLGDLTE